MQLVGCPICVAAGGETWPVGKLVGEAEPDGDTGVAVMVVVGASSVDVSPVELVTLTQYW